jgi:hypothetical protein
MKGRKWGGKTSDDNKVNFQRCKKAKASGTGRQVAVWETTVSLASGADAVLYPLKLTNIPWPLQTELH